MKKLLLLLIVPLLLFCGCDNAEGQESGGTSAQISDTASANGQTESINTSSNPQTSRPVSDTEKAEQQSDFSNTGPAAESTAAGVPSQRLTVEEYTEAVNSAWTQYRDEGYGVFIRISLEVGDADLSKVEKEKKDEIIAACDKMDEALDKFAAMNPPAEYQDMHDNLVASTADEKRWNEYRRKGFSAETEKEANEYFDKIAEEVNAADSNTTFPHLYLELYKKLNNMDF